jgi:hypothetical protein
MGLLKRAVLPIPLLAVYYCPRVTVNVCIWLDGAPYLTLADFAVLQRTHSRCGYKCGYNRAPTRAKMLRA